MTEGFKQGGPQDGEAFPPTLGISALGDEPAASLAALPRLPSLGCSTSLAGRCPRGLLDEAGGSNLGPAQRMLQRFCPREGLSFSEAAGFNDLPKGMGTRPEARAEGTPESGRPGAAERCTCRAGAGGSRQGGGGAGPRGSGQAGWAGGSPGGAAAPQPGPCEQTRPSARRRVPAALTNPGRCGGGGRRAALSPGPLPRPPAPLRPCGGDS